MSNQVSTSYRTNISDGIQSNHHVSISNNGNFNPEKATEALLKVFLGTKDEGIPPINPHHPSPEDVPTESKEITSNPFVIHFSQETSNAQKDQSEVNKSGNRKPTFVDKKVGTDDDPIISANPISFSTYAITGLSGLGFGAVLFRDIMSGNAFAILKSKINFCSRGAVLLTPVISASLGLNTTQTLIEKMVTLPSEIKKKYEAVKKHVSENSNIYKAAGLVFAGLALYFGAISTQKFLTTPLEKDGIPKISLDQNQRNDLSHLEKKGIESTPNFSQNPKAENLEGDPILPKEFCSYKNGGDITEETLKEVIGIAKGLDGDSPYQNPKNKIAEIAFNSLKHLIQEELPPIAKAFAIQVLMSNIFLIQD